MGTLNDIRTAIITKTPFEHDGDLTPNGDSSNFLTPENDFNPSGADQNPLIDSFDYEFSDGEFILLWITDIEINENGDAESLTAEMWEEDYRIERQVIRSEIGVDHLPGLAAVTVGQWLADHLSLE